MINYRRITTMSCEALANFICEEITDHCCDSCPAYSDVCRDKIFKHSNLEEYKQICKQNMIEWLNKESN